MSESSGLGAPGAAPFQGATHATRRWLPRTVERLFQRSPVEGSLRIAMLMVVVSIATGPMTYLATEHAELASEASDRALEEFAEQGFLERTVQAAIDREEQRFATYVHHRSRYLAHIDAASDGGDSHHVLESQAEWDQTLLAWSGFQWAYPDFDDEARATYPRAAAEEAMRVEHEQGRLLELEGSAEAALELGAGHRLAVLQLVTLIAVAIGALLLMTVAQVVRGRERRIFAAAGILVALIAFVGVAVVDQSGPGQLVALGSTAAIAFMAIGDRIVRPLRGLLARRMPIEDSHDVLDPESAAVGGARLGLHSPSEVTTLFARMVAVAIAVGTLCGAWIGYVQADAFGRADAARSVAQRRALEANIVAVAPEARAYHELAAWDRAIEARFAVFAAQQALAAHHASGDHAGMADAESELRHLEQTRDALAALVDIEAFGPGEDEEFPARLLAEAQRDHDASAAMQYIADADAREWTERGSLYVRLLVVLAVAVYLLGLAVVIEGQRVKIVFFAFGCGGVALAALLTGWTLVDKPTSALAGADARARAAAAAYAEGRVQARLGEWSAARDAFAAAIDETSGRPDFAHAHGRLADVEFLAGSSQRFGFTSVSHPDSVRRSLRHRSLAIGLGQDSYANRVNLGYESFLAALQTLDPGRREELLEQSSTASRAAIQMLSGKPLPVFNLAVTELAVGNAGFAEAAYDDAIANTRDHPERDQLLRGAITDLEVLRFYRPDLATVVDERQRVLVAELAGDEPLAAEPRETGEVRAEASGTTLYWYADLGQLVDDDSIIQVWYRRSSSEEPWVVYSGPEVVVRSDEPGERGLVNFFEGEDDLEEPHQVETDVAASTAECLPEGDYRVEVFVNGTLHGRSDEIGASSALHAWWAQELGLLACIPTDWTRLPAEDREPGRSDGYIGPDGQGLVFARVHDAGPGEAIDRATEVLAALRATGIGGVPGGLEVDEVLDGAFFVGLIDEASEVWRSDAFEYRAQAGVAGTGTILVGILFGPTGFLDEDDASADPVGLTYVRMADWWGLRPTVGPGG